MTKRTIDTAGRRRAAAAAAPALAGAQWAAAGQPGAMTIVREWTDALVIAFVLAIFVRIFLVELYKIPSGSMTPTLVGGEIAMVDYNRDGLKDMLLFLGGGPRLQRGPQRPLLFLGTGGGSFDAQGFIPVTAEVYNAWLHCRERFDRIIVNKLAYWFHAPRRGDIVVFKVPPSIWEPDKPVYIKRTAGEPLDHLTFADDGHLMVNGAAVQQPSFYRSQRYDPAPMDLARWAKNPEVTYSADHNRIKSIDVPSGQIYVFGDNTNSSLDSRYWGGVPLNNVKGRAFFRFLPLSEMRFFHGSKAH